MIFQVPELPTAPAARLIHCLEHEDRGNINDGSHWKDGAFIRVCFSVSKVAALSEPNSRVYIQRGSGGGGVTDLPSIRVGGASAVRLYLRLYWDICELLLEAAEVEAVVL